MAGSQVDRLVWLVSKVVSAGDNGILLSDIQSAWEEKFGEVYPRRTFNNHRTKIEEIFGITMKCHRQDNTYYFPYYEDALDPDHATNWLIDTFTVSNMLSLKKDRLSGRISVEEVPSGHKFLTSIIAAMDRNRVLSIVYEKYDASAPETLTVSPYGVKVFAQRWYLVGWCRERDAMRVYGLDRIRSLSETGASFQMSGDFSVDDLFTDSFGIYLPEGQKAETVIIKTSHKEAGYLRDLPIHPSQIELPTEERGICRFAIRVIPNDNFYMELSKFGARIEVVSPRPVREKLAHILRSAASLYKDIQ